MHEKFKVFGFVRRNARLTHDEYRAAHVGYHNSFGRRLPNIRGYLLNVRANRALSEALGEDCVDQMTWGEPADFDDQWDGWGQLLFDSHADYLAARSPARDRAGPDGLGFDEGVAGVGGDFEHLYSGSPFQFHVEEHVCAEVMRPEHKLFKLAHFVKRQDSVSQADFDAAWVNSYAKLVGATPGLRGMIVNHRSALDVMTGFFAPDSEGFTAEGVERRNTFYSGWDSLIEYWFDDPDAYRNFRAETPDLPGMEKELLAHSFYREVDETVAVMPNRLDAPDFYHR